MSSYCKNCGAYLTFNKNGKIEARAKEVRNPFEDRPPQPKVEIDYRPREEPGVRPPPPPPRVTPPSPPTPLASEEGDVSEEDPEPERPEKDEKVKMEEETFPEPLVESELTEAESEVSKFVSPVESSDEKSPKKPLKTRRAICFECGDVHEANALANSTQCHKCGRLISLANHEIKTHWNSRVQTRGDVFIHRKGVVTGAIIQCHHLVVEGEFTGSVECSGDLTLRRHGKIMGKIVCNRLFVERRAKVDFLNPVETNECRIDGLVTGQISCRGRLALEKRATLTGDIRVGTLTVADGAKHSGQIQMGGF